MKCPVDDTELRMTDRQGIEIDYCPKCRGVWLDRGELDKIIERSGSPAQEAEPPPPPPPQGYRDDYRGHGQYERGHHRDHRRYRKRKSFLSELFDFD